MIAVGRAGGGASAGGGGAFSFSFWCAVNTRLAIVCGDTEEKSEACREVVCASRASAVTLPLVFEHTI